MDLQDDTMAQDTEAMSDTTSLLDRLLSMDREAVRVEAAMNTQEVVQRMVSLLLSASPSDNHRHLAAVILRRRAKSWQADGAADASELKAGLLLALSRTSSAARVFRAVAACVAAFGALPAMEPWPELVPFALTMARHEDASHRGLAWYLCNLLAEFCVEGPVITDLVSSSIPLLSAALDDSDSMARVEALRAAVSMLISTTDTDLVESLRSIWPGVMRALERTISEDDDAAADALASIVEVAVQTPKLLQGSLDETVRCMLTIAKHSDLSDRLRQCALDFIVTVAEEAGSLARRSELLFQQAVPLSLSLMSTVEEDPTWRCRTEDNTDEDDEHPLPAAGEQALDRMALSLGAAIVTDALTPCVESMLSTTSWQQHHAAIRGVGIVAEACGHRLDPLLDSVVPFVLAKIVGPNPRLQHAAIFCVSQLVEHLSEPSDDGDSFVDRFGREVLNKLVHVCANSIEGAERVRGFAASAIVEVCDPYVCTREILEADGLADRLVAGLAKVVTECRAAEAASALAAFGVVAEVLGDGFLPHYRSFADLVLALIRGNRPIPTSPQLRATAMEALATVGVSMGRDVFHDDGVALLAEVVALHDSTVPGTEHDDATSDLVQRTLCLLSDVLDDAFAPHFPRILPGIVHRAALDVNVSVDEGVGVSGVDGGESFAVNIRGVGEQRISIDTASLQAKVAASQLLSSYLCRASSLEPFLPFIDMIVPAIVENMQCIMSSEVRMHAYQAVRGLVRLAVEHPSPSLACRLVPALASLLTGHHSAFDSSQGTSVAVTCLAESLQLCCSSGASEIVAATVRAARELFARLGDLLSVGLSEYHERRKLVLVDGDDIDDMNLESELSSLEGVLFPISEALGCLMRCCGSDAMPFVQQHIMPFVRTVVADAEMPSQLLSIAMCIMDDGLEHCGVAGELLTFAVPVLVSNAAHPSASVRQAAVYGIGVCAMNGDSGDEFSSAAADVVAPLQGAALSSVGNPDEYSAPDCADNAISALFKLAVFRGVELGPHVASTVVDFVLQRVPLTHDAEEARYLHGAIFSGIIDGHLCVGGSEEDRVGTLIRTFAAVLHAHALAVDEDPGSPLLSEETLGHVMDVARVLEARAGADAYRAVLASLPTPMQAALPSNT